MRTLHTMMFATALLVACSGSEPSVAPTPAPPVTDPELVATTPDTPDPAEKTYAPVDLRLTATARQGAAELVLTVVPRVDVPNARARIVLPEGVALVSGVSEVELGALAKGAKASLAVQVRIPAQGSYVIAGGVEVVMSPARKLARSTVLALGEATKSKEPRVIELPEGGKVRVP